MKTVKKRSQLQEKSVAKNLGGRVVVASGALWSAKGDVRNDNYLVECKTTRKDFYTITSKVWEKIVKEANSDHLRTPLLVVDLRDYDRYVIFPYNILESELENEHTHTFQGKGKSFTFKGLDDLPYIIATFKSLSGLKDNKIVAVRFQDLDKYINI